MSKKKKEKISEAESDTQQMIDSQPNLIKVLATPGFVSSTQSHANSNTSDGWKEHLGRIKKASGRNNTIKL